MRKVVIKGNAYTLQSPYELDVLMTKGMEWTSGLYDDIDKYVEGADEVIEGDVTITLEADTEYFFRDEFTYGCTEDYIEKDMEKERAERARLS